MRWFLSFFTFILLLMFSACGSNSNNGSSNGPQNEINLLSSPTSFIAGACSGPYVLGFQNSSNQPEAATTDIPLNLASSTLNHGLVFSDADCLNSVTSLDIPTSQSQVSFFIQDTIVETLNVNVVSTFGTLTVSPTIAPGQTAALSVTGPDSGILGECVGPINVATEDAYGNLTSSSGVQLATNNSTQVLSSLTYSDSECQNIVTSVSTSPSGSLVYLQVIGNSSTSTDVDVTLQNLDGLFSSTLNVDLITL